MSTAQEASVNHDCPGPTKGNCKEFTETVTVDVGVLWNEPETCFIDYEYKYKICFDDNTYTFQVIKSDLETYLMSSDQCAEKFLNFTHQNLINSIKADILLADAALSNTAQTIANTFTQSLLNKYECDNGTFFLTGTYYYGPCAATCVGFKATENPKKPIAVVKYKNIVCGANCCFATAQFCIGANSKVGDVNLEGEFLGFQSATTGTFCTQTASNKCPDIPGVLWYKNGIAKCYSACDLDLGKTKSNYHPDKKIKKENFNINEEAIKVNISQQEKTFVFDFKTQYSGRIFLLDTNGRNVYSNLLSNIQGEFLIDASNLPSGIYFVYLQNENTSVNKKIFLH